MRRRELLLGGAAAGALLALRPPDAFARSFLRTAVGGATSRASRLFPDDGLRLAHADLHNHTLLSDGAGRADEAFAQLRTAGLDVASLTDHAVFGSVVQDSLCDGCSAASGIDENGWSTLGQVAQAADVPDEFVAIRGFEWTTPHLGHINVWFSEQWIDALNTGSLAGPEAALAFCRDNVEPSRAVLDPLIPLFQSLPTATSIDGFYDWLSRPPGGTGFGGGGADALAGFNHPNEYGNFEEYKFFGNVADRVVSVELLNRFDDYLFRGTAEGKESPLNAVLNAGWKVGALGVTDEHGNRFDVEEGKGRAGLWVRSLTRDGVREALAARRFYATRLAGLRLDAAAGGARMGSDLVHRRGPVTVVVDVGKGPEWYGKRLLAQVLVAGPAGGMPVIARTAELVVPGPDAGLPSFDVDLDVETSPWAVLRLTDPEAPAHAAATGDFAAAGDVVAYASPWFLKAEGAAAGSAAGPPAPAAVAVDAATGATLAASGGSAPVGAAIAAAGAALAARWLARSPGHHHH